MKRVLVLGGTGFVGRHLCEKLVRAGWSVTVATRRRGNASAVLSLPGLEVVQADVHGGEALARLLSGHDAVVNLVAILHGNAAAFERAHVALPRTLAQACLATGVRRVVHISALGAVADAPSLYQRSKAAGEAVLREAGLSLTVLRPSVIFGAGDRFLNLFARLQAVLPVMPLAGAHARLQPVWVEDVAQAVVRCLADDRTAGHTYEACGPDVRSLAGLVRLAGQWAGVNAGLGRPVIPIPMALGRLQALLMELAPGEPLMSRDNLASLTVDNIASGSLPGLQNLGIVPASLAAVAPGYLGDRGPRSALDALRRTAGR
jgi:uncharacterized protein YbjT (DUF2867 family)